MIISLSEAKAFLQISAATYDTLITALIPEVEGLALERTKNYFHALPQVVNSLISFVASSKSVLNSSSNFLSIVPNYDSPYLNNYELQMNTVRLKFQGGMWIHIKGSMFNDGVHLIKSVPDGSTLILDDSETVFDEDFGALITISRMHILPGFKLALSKLIGYFLIKNYGIKSRSLGDLSETYASEDEAFDMILKPYKKITG